MNCVATMTDGLPLKQLLVFHKINEAETQELSKDGDIRTDAVAN